MENIDLNHPKDSLSKEWQRMKNQVPLIHRGESRVILLSKNLGFVLFLM